jgi:uncharacterized membrane protein
VRLLRRPPPGAAATLFVVVALLVSAAFDEDIEGVGAALVAGLVLDALLRTRVTRAAAFALASAILWFGYLGALAVVGIDWQAEIWIGAAVLNTIAAYAIASTTPEELQP